MASKLIRRALAASVPDGLPSEFRLFRAGVNRTAKGDLIFDADAADRVMAAFDRWGVDLMIDLEHQALDADGSARADAADARGWFRLAVRNGELWAVNVRWTKDGARRLSEKTQRYISPAVLTDDDDRVVEVLNAALVAMPATHHAAPLAASRSTVLAARVPHEHARRFRAHAKALGVRPGMLLRMLAQDIAAGDKDARAEIVSVLGLPEDADLDAVIDAVKALFAEPESDPLAEAPGSPPADAFRRKTTPARLTDRERAECAKRGITPAAFLKAKAAAARRTAAPKAKPSKPAPVTLSAADREHCRRRKIDPAEFLRRKRAAVRTT